MRQFAVVSVLMFAACSSAADELPASVLAIRDYIAVAELTEVRKFRSDDRNKLGMLDTTRYVLLETRRQIYLIEFVRNCQELTGMRQVGADVRSEGDYLRVGRDTIRGCRIRAAYKVDEGQAEEIRSLGDAPTRG